MLLPAGIIFSPQADAAAVVDSSASPLDPSNGIPNVGVPGAKKNATFAETMELLLAIVPQVAPPATNLPIDSINPPAQATAPSEQTILNLNLKSALPQPARTPDAIPDRTLPAISTTPHFMSMAPSESESLLDFETIPQLETPPLDAAAAGAAVPTVLEGIETPPQPAADGISSLTPELNADPIDEPSIPPAAEATSEKPASASSLESVVAFISESDAGAAQLAVQAKLAFSPKEDRRVQTAESAEQTSHTLPASSMEHGSPSPSASVNHPRAVQHAAGIADQIKDALLTYLGEQREPGRTVLHVRLNPPELGQVRVHLMTYDDQVTGRVVVQEEAVRAALESQMPELRQRLEQAGIALGRFDVAHDGRDQTDARHERPAPVNGFAWRAPAALSGAATTPTSRGLIDMLA